MRTFIRLLLGLAFVGSLNAADLITATVIVSTNAPIGNTNSITINGNTRVFTNTVTGSPGTLIQETNSIPWTATNLLNHLTDYKVSTAYFLGQSTSTNVTIRGTVGGPMVVTLAGGWGHVTYSTQTVSSPTFVVRVPITVEAVSNQTQIASHLVKGMSDSSTNTFSTNAVALSNYITKGASPRQHVSSELLVAALYAAKGRLTNIALVNSTNSGYIAAITNGYSTNLIADNLTVTNLNAPGDGAFSQRLGANSSADGENSIAIGQGTTSDAENATTVGTASSSFDVNDSAFGAGTESSGGSSVSLGFQASTGATNAAALGARAISIYQNSSAIGADSATTKSNQVVLGNSTSYATIPGVLEVSGTQTNTTFTGTNNWNGDISFQRRANSSPVNGDNSGVILGTNVTISITGPTTIGAYCGFASERSDSFHFIRFSGAITNIIRNQSGLEATADNRIITGTGGDLTLTNDPSWIQLIRNGTSSRWEVIAHSR